MQLPAPEGAAVRRTVWIALLVLAAIGTSLVFACATPFAALAALAAISTNRRDAYIITGTTWLVNQAIGYGFLHYPHMWGTFAWGIAIFAGAMIATAAASATNMAARSMSLLVTVPASFVAAFAGYEITLFATTAVLPSDSSAFGFAVMLYILKINVVAFCGLLILHYIGLRTGLAHRQIVDATPAVV